MIAIDMPMPKNCDVCRLYIEDYDCDYCSAIEDGTEEARYDHRLLHRQVRPEFCPLIDLNERKEGTDDA